MTARGARIAIVSVCVGLAVAGTLTLVGTLIVSLAYVGNVGADRVVDFTAVGDPVNTAARMQALAAAGEVLLADDLYPEVSDRFPGAPHRTLAIRGRETPVGAYVVRVAA